MVTVFIIAVVVVLVLGLGYWALTFIQGYVIAQKIQQFNAIYDPIVKSKRPKGEAFLEAVRVFKTCSPYNQLTPDEWARIEMTFPLLSDPRRIFLALLLRPSGTVMKCFRNPNFFKDISKLDI